MAVNFIWWLIFKFIFVQTMPTVNSYTLYPENEPSKTVSQRHLVVGASLSPLVKDANITLVSVGIFDAIIIDMLADSLHFTYEVRAPTDDLSLGALLPNGSWTGNVGQIQRKEVDICVSSSPPISSKLSFSDTSVPISFADSAILIPFPTEQLKLWVFSSVFTRQAWIALGGSLLVMIVSVWLVNKFTTIHPNRSQNTLSYWVLHFISFCTSQGNTLQNSSISFRTVTVTSMFAIFITANYFTASYTSLLSIPNFQASVNSFEDLANNKDVKTLLIKGSGTDEYIMSSTNPLVKKIADQARRHPERRLDDVFFTKDISTIVKDNSALVMIKSNAESLVENSYNYNNGTCRVTLAKETFFSRPLTYTFPKNSPIRKSFDKQILLLYQAGLIDYAKRRSATNSKRCSVSEIKKFKSEKVFALEMKDMIGIFLVLGVGLFIGSVAFMAEIVVAKLSKKK